MSLFPFRQISEFPTGAALLNERTAVYDEKVYRSFGGVGIAVWCTLHTGKCLWIFYSQETGWYRGRLSSLCTLCRGTFLFHRKLRPMKQKSAPQGCALGAKVDGC